MAKSRYAISLVTPLWTLQKPLIAHPAANMKLYE